MHFIRWHIDMEIHDIMYKSPNNLLTLCNSSVDDNSVTNTPEGVQGYQYQTCVVNQGHLGYYISRTSTDSYKIDVCSTPYSQSRNKDNEIRREAPQKVNTEKEIITKPLE